MPDSDYVFVDIETTGGNAVYDRITEIAWIHTYDNQVVAKDSLLLNPEAHIPEQIQMLTGITNAMVEHCPTFEEVAEELLDQFKDKVFVAHNARFDYGFVKNAFRRCNITFSAPVLCTVKLSRKLYPEFKRHNLDTLIERHQLSCSSRHRAMGDAQVLVEFMQKARKDLTESKVNSTIQELLKRPNLPAGIHAQDIERLPQTPGVYIFYNENNQPLYVGKSVNLYSRIISHFNSDHRSQKDIRIGQQIHRIETIQTAGELSALLKESQLVKELQPPHNRQLRRYRCLYTIYWDLNNATITKPRICEISKGILTEPSSLFGLFRSKKQATNRLKKIAKENNLCLKFIGLEKGTGPCFAYQLKKCHGVCMGKESAIQHQIRCIEGLSSIRIKDWPYPGPVTISEVSDCGKFRETHYIDHWIYYGTVEENSEMYQMNLFDHSISFDIDTYKILVRFLNKKNNKLHIEYHQEHAEYIN